MIVLVVSSSDRQLVENVAKILIDEKFAIDLTIETLERIRLKGDKLESRNIYRLMGKTKALLFPSINKKLRSEFDDVLPEIYSIPIVHMEWEQTLKLRQDVQGV